MALLSQAMRAAAFTGSADSMFTRIAGRQGGRWAERTVEAAYPAARSQQPTRLRELTELRERGVLTPPSSSGFGLAPVTRARSGRDSCVHVAD
jgi:hypothetical protein